MHTIITTMMINKIKRAAESTIIIISCVERNPETVITTSVVLILVALNSPSLVITTTGSTWTIT